MKRSLKKKKVEGKAYLYSCNGGTTYKHSSVAREISARLYGTRTRAVVNGSVYYRDWYQLFDYKPLTKEKGAYWADFYWTKSGLGIPKVSKIGRSWKL